jgi:hypothetical protein
VECGDYKLPEGVDDFGDTHYVDDKHAFHCCVCTNISVLTVMHRDIFAELPSRSSMAASAVGTVPTIPPAASTTSVVPVAPVPPTMPALPVEESDSGDEENTAKNSVGFLT